MRTGRWRLAAAGAVVLTVIGAATIAARWQPAVPDPSNATDARWRAIPNTFAAPVGATAAAVLLMPAPDGCFFALGTVDGGVRRHQGRWVGTGGCDTARLHWPLELPPTSPMVTQRDTVVDAVERAGDWLTVVASSAGDRTWIEIVQGTADHAVSSHMRLEPRHTNDVPTAVGVVDNLYTVVGLHDGEPMVALSAIGSSWQDRPLPAPAGGDARPLSVAGAPSGVRPHPDPSGVEMVHEAGPGVVVGHNDSGSVIWATTDRAATWSVREHPTGSILTDVIHDGTGFVAVGAARDGSALVLVSADGVTWNVDPRTMPTDVPPLRSVYALRPPSDPQAPLVIGGDPPPPATVFAVGLHDDGGAQPTDRCAAAWRRDETTWVAESLGCHGLPTALLQLPDRRIVAVGGTTLWVRRP